MGRIQKRDSQPGERDQKPQGWRRRIMRGTEQTPEADLKQSQEILEWALRKHSPDSSFVIKAMIDVADQMARQNRTAEELELREQVLEGLRNSLAPEDLRIASAEMVLAGVLSRLERYRAANDLLAHVITVRTRALGADDPATLRATSLRANVEKMLE